MWKQLSSTNGGLNKMKKRKTWSEILSRTDDSNSSTEAGAWTMRLPRIMSTSSTRCHWGWAFWAIYSASAGALAWHGKLIRSVIHANRPRWWPKWATTACSLAVWTMRIRRSGWRIRRWKCSGKAVVHWVNFCPLTLNPKSIARDLHPPIDGQESLDPSSLVSSTTHTLALPDSASIFSAMISPSLMIRNQEITTWMKGLNHFIIFLKNAWKDIQYFRTDWRIFELHSTTSWCLCHRTHYGNDGKWFYLPGRQRLVQKYGQTHQVFTDYKFVQTGRAFFKKLYLGTPTPVSLPAVDLIYSTRRHLAIWKPWTMRAKPGLWKPMISFLTEAIRTPSGLDTSLPGPAASTWSGTVATFYRLANKPPLSWHWTEELTPASTGSWRKK